MAKLRKTLPKEFREFYYSRPYKWTQEDIIQCKKLLEPCEPNARERSSDKKTALHFLVPFEIAEWLIERGADVNAATTYGTPLFKHAYVGHYDICKLLIEHGADVNIEDFEEETALFHAADNGYFSVVELLLEHGADPCHHTCDFAGRLTPLLSMLRGISYAPTKNQADTAELLVKAQREHGEISEEEWKQAQKMIEKIGHNYNLYKNDMAEDYRNLIQCEEAMKQLYTFFDVPVAAEIIKHNGKTPIVVDDNLSVEDQHQALWEFFVPAQGKCVTVQGEVIRITGRVEDESKGNAGVNWDKEYRKMLKALPEFLEQGNGLDAKEKEAVYQAVFLINASKACGCWEETDRLKELAVKWVKQNAAPILLGEVDYQR